MGERKVKTFKLCSLAILFDDKQNYNNGMRGKDIPLVDGLIINKEEARKNWLLEAVVEQKWAKFFEPFLKEGKKFMAEVTITRKTNDPATLVCKVRSIHKLKDHYSVHFDGILVVKKDDLSDMLLRNLINEGYEGEELYAEFKRRKQDRGQAIQGILTSAYAQVKDKGFNDLDRDE